MTANMMHLLMLNFRFQFSSAKAIYRACQAESPIPVPETPSAFHRPVPQTVFRRPDVRRQSRLFVPPQSTAETQPKLHPALLRLSAMSSQYFNETVASFSFDKW